MSKRHLDKLRFIIKEAVGLDITYAYDDLVFPEHTAFLFQFDDTDEHNFFCYFHKDCIPEEKTAIAEKLAATCKANDCTVDFKNDFELAPKGQEFEIRFLKEARHG